MYLRDDDQVREELRCIYEYADEGFCWGRVTKEPVPPVADAAAQTNVPVCEGHLPMLLGGAYQLGPNLTVQ